MEHSLSLNRILEKIDSGVKKELKRYLVSNVNQVPFLMLKKS